MSVDRKRSMIEPSHHRLSIWAQCGLLSISRSSYYYTPVPQTDATYLDMPWYGSRQMRFRGFIDAAGSRLWRLSSFSCA